MQDFDQQRYNMIESQLKVADIHNPNVIAAYEKIKREDLFPSVLQSLAYRDQHFKVDFNRHQIRPVYEAKIIQSANILKNEIALIVGAYPGCGLLVVSQLASVVIALENSNEKIEKINKHIINDAVNIFVKYFDFDNKLQTAPSQNELMDAEIDVIIFFESLPHKPEAYLKLLADKGRLIAPINLYPVNDNNHLAPPLQNSDSAYDITLSKVIKYQKNNDSFDKFELFEAFMPVFYESRCVKSFSL